MEMAEMKNGKEDTVMKKMNSIRIAAALLMGAATFSACEITFTVPEEEAIPCVLTVEATKGEDDATKALADAGTTITATWEVNDEVQVYNSSDVKLGTIRATTAGASTTLTGTLDSTPVLGDVLTLKFKSPSYADQEGTLDFIASNCDYATATVTVVAADKGYGTAVTTKASFVNQQAIVKFTLKNKSGSANLPVTSLTISDGTNSYTVTPASATNVLYVALPGFSDQTMTLTADTEKYGLVRTGVTFENGKYYTRTVKMLPYFTVGAGKHVLFAPGNLQATYDASGSGSWTWNFATHQYDFIGNNPGNNNIKTQVKLADAPYAELKASGSVDLFGWSTLSTYYGIATSKDNTYYSSETLTDWGNLAIGSYEPGFWRTKTSAEWAYLLETRSASTIGGTSDARYIQAQVNSINGVIFFPDAFTWDTTTYGDAPANCNVPNAGYTSLICDTERWNSLESAGCVFLPNCGFRSGEYADGAGGRYWSSTKYSSYVAYYFVPYPVGMAHANNTCTGMAVRLVREL